MTPHTIDAVPKTSVLGQMKLQFPESEAVDLKCTNFVLLALLVWTAHITVERLSEYQGNQQDANVLRNVGEHPCLDT